ncbi:hypothetical protein [Cryobacterium sp. Y11]|uniref:hypothetical protein n=1 Tax=Cryobacterium sp. Y11 TaxID=2045016 RepID=UPI0011B010A1|nr:hypothetical protein [Cryobacterium sp. Y11]
MSRQVTKTALSGMIVIAALSGCATTTAEPKPTTAAAVTDFVTPIEPTWTIDVDLVGKPIYQNGYVASYVAAADGALNVIAWDATSGVEVWRDVAAVGAATQGVVVNLDGLESGGKSFVTYLSPIVGDDSGWTELVIAEIGSGISTSITNNMVWATQRPAACADDIAVCFTGFLQAAHDADKAKFHVDPKGGTIVADTDVVMPAKARMLNDRLFSTNARTPDGVEELGYSADGAIAWQIPYSDIFAEGYSSDGGWNWDLSASAIRAVNVAGTLSLVNALTGDVTDLPDGAIFACGQYRDGFEAMQQSSGDVFAYGSGYDEFPCTSDLVAIEGTAYSAGAVRMGGLETGENTFVIGGASGLSSYTLLD